ncbi:MAG: DUF4147 domain-containing protein [Gammaproteobacteria bacterium]|nr:DUF4147 domain-containing protein [Gammaproteobacteria bacterium]
MKNLHDQERRDVLLNLYSRALAVVNGRHCVASFLSDHPLPAKKVRVIAIGKAASSMLQGALDSCIHAIEAGLIITKDGHLDDLGTVDIPVEKMESGHPYPDRRSLAAGRLLLDFIAQMPAETGVLFLLSGGASALVEVLPEGVTVEKLDQLNRWLLARGWPIDQMNRIRKSVSCIKAGRLARYLKQHDVMQLLISDVPRDDLSVIGSGLLIPDAQPAVVSEPLPAWIVDMQSAVPSAPMAGDSCFAKIQTRLIASNAILRAEVERLARTAGFAVQCNRVLEGDAARQGRQIAQALRDGQPGIYIWGGESVVTLPEQPGQGGRCQHLALAAAQALAGHAGISVLAVGSDGTDGPGDTAGALIDGGTLERAQDAGAGSADSALRRADAGRFLDAAGDLIDTGPTGTNVMDLIIGLKN